MYTRSLTCATRAAPRHTRRTDYYNVKYGISTAGGIDRAGLNDVPDKGYRAGESKGEASATGAGGINQAMTPYRVPMCDEGSMCDAGR